MKLFKKIAAIMLSIMMVLGMASVVSADATTSGKYGNNNGTITISNAIKDHTYTIYRILKLESFSNTGTTGNYAYKAETNWENFIKNTKTNDNKSYLVEDNSGYVTWNTEVTQDDANKIEFAKKALEYAKDTSHNVTAVETAIATATEVTFSNLSLGYYLVDSSVGALCSLDTTAKDATIQEKNDVPSVDKKVQEDSKSAWGDSNTADIGQTVNFQTTITAQPGAQSYVLHDKMDVGLTFTEDSVAVKFKSGGTETNLTKDIEYTLTTSGFTDNCTFEIEFTQTFCDTLAKDDKIIVTYSATLNEKAVIAGEGNKNTTKLTYGDSSETTSSTTTTKTFELPVFKYTKDGTKEKELAGATFTLSKKSDGTDPIKLVSVSNDATEGDTYRVAKENEATGTAKITEITTTKSGKFTIKGLDADTYYLTETQQPAGYNKLSAPITVVIDDNGNITVDNGTSSVTEVKVQNNTGSLLPSTGGSGTTLIYILGAILVLGSSVVLITKKRMR